MRAAFYTLGCKVNQYETEFLMSAFADAGFDIVSDLDIADVYVINSCTVTAMGDKKSRQMLRRYKRQNPGAVIALTGCFPQAFPEDVRQIAEADVITGTRERAQLPSLVKQAMATGERIIQILPHERKENFEKMQISRFADRTRAFVKIQDGCTRYCSYCIIPTARGPVRSKPLEDIRTELENLAQNGYREIVLTGINLSSYGLDLGLKLLDAVQTACSVHGIERIRLGSLEPELLTKEDIAVMASLPKLCPQFHLSLQSGCDKTLRRMNRHYNTAEYRQIVENIRQAFENPAITTDIMVGFAGETSEEFAQSLQYVEEIGFARIHVFAYSIRPGTRAASFPHQLDNMVKEARSEQMIALGDRLHEKFCLQQIGRVEKVLFEKQTENFYQGYTPNYTPVRVYTDNDLSGKIICTKISNILGKCCVGELCENIEFMK
ncbi:MAG TPA: tRNA (N(6)-L-threonylcarbamoyladenosine(37)-C(2))-methylthiotransferase MtaB [Firmicutes bacterium]|nr:tRNA (N(6)-L-threonylcarbamoyladenosine(37)-C(2))-methylthiotransferase MtaB [Bacillota bacterium]